MNKDISCDRITDNWYKGNYKDMEFTAYLFEEPSKFGIDNGRVSKLCITDADGGWLVNYDRGWDVEPTADTLSDYTDVLKYLDSVDMGI